MIWKEHSELKGTHAFLSPSKPNWLNDTQDELIVRRIKSYAQAIGTKLHAFAEDLINKSFRLHKSDKRMAYFYLISEPNPIPEWAVVNFDDMFENLMTYVNDAIGFRTKAEQILYFSNDCYGTADAISFRDNKLQIFDLKTGTTPAHIEQLETYAALFCLEYGKDPVGLEFDLRLYQSGDIIMHSPDPQDIRELSQKVVSANKTLNTM